MAVDKLGIYNNALHLLGERRLSNLYEDREPRHVLDKNYDLALVDHCLELAMPRFAVKSAKLANPTTSSVHGVDEVYSFPADYVSVLRDPGTHGSIGSFFADEDFEQPVNRYLIEGNTVACEIGTNLYLRYVSNAIQPSGWTSMFSRLVSTYLALQCASRINPSRIDYLTTEYDKALQQVIAVESVKENQFITQKAAADLSTDQLAIYNLVAAALGKPELRGIADDSALRLAIDSVYAVSELTCLDTIRPKFATRVVQLATGSTSAVHDLDNVFALPADFQTIIGLWADADLENKIHRYFIEDTNIAIEGYDPAYLRYISTASAEANYSPKFTTALAAYIALELAPRFAPELKSDLFSVLDKRITEAVASEAVKESHFPQDVPAVLSADQIIVYNKAAAALGVTEIRFGSDESEFRHAVDSVYDQAERVALELVQPRFAARTVALSSGGVHAEHDLDNVFALPADYQRIVGLWADIELQNEIRRYIIEDTNIAIDGYDPAYLRYISNDSDEVDWTATFKDVVAACIARDLAPRFKPDASQALDAELTAKIAVASSIEGVKEVPRLPQASTSLSATALQVYNIAAAAVSQPELRFAADESELRHALDSLYENSTNFLLEQIRPRFATRVVELTGPATSTVHGFDNVFTLPADFKNFVGLWSDDLLDEPVERYFIEDDDIAVAHHATVYLRYVSTATAETEWMPSFIQALGMYLASQVAPRFKPEESSRANARFETAMQASIAVDGIKEASRPLAATRTLTTVYRSLYNKALEILKLPPIISNDDESARKVALDYAIDNEAVETVLELISWGFARKSVKLEADDVVEPAWGLQNAFEVPSDMLRIDAISGDEYFRYPATYMRQDDYFFCDCEDVYVSYVSSDHATALSSWPAYFTNLVAAELAKRIADKDNLILAMTKYDEYKSEAYSTDAQRNPPQLITSGSWTESRFSGYPTRRDRRRP